MPAASNWNVGAAAAVDAGAMVEAGAGAPGMLGREPKLKLTGALAIGAVEGCIVTAGRLTGAPKLGAVGWVAGWKLGLANGEGATGPVEKKDLFCVNTLPLAMPFVVAPNTPVLGDGFSGDCSGDAILMSSLNLFPGDCLVGVPWALKPPKSTEGGGACGVVGGNDWLIVVTGATDEPSKRNEMLELGKDVVIAGVAAVAAPELKIAEVVTSAGGADVVVDLENRLPTVIGSAGFAPPATKLNVLAVSPAGFAVPVKLNDVGGAGLAPKSTFGAVAVSPPKVYGLTGSTTAGAGTGRNKAPVAVVAAPVPNVPKFSVLVVFGKGAADTLLRLLKRFVLDAVPVGLGKLIVAGASAGLLNKLGGGAMLAAFVGKSDRAGATEVVGAVDKPLKINGAVALGATAGSIWSLASPFVEGRRENELSLYIIVGAAADSEGKTLVDGTAAGGTMNLNTGSGIADAGAF